MIRQWILTVLLLSGVMRSLWGQEAAGLPMPESSLTTRWTDEVTARGAWPEYPRPAMKRNRWQNLNGLWQYAITAKAAEKPEVVDGEILVPFAVESRLSGVQRTVSADQALWYRRRFNVPARWQGQRLLLHFGAVDWQATVWVNDQKMGVHEGGYDPFTLDITDALIEKGEQTVVVRVWDPTDQDNAAQPRGKQVLHPGGIFYTAVTGIWQTVWLEPVAHTYIKNLFITPDIDTSRVKVTAEIVGAQPHQQLQLTGQIKEGWFVKAKARCDVNEPLIMTLRKPRLWSPDHPNLYEVGITLHDRQHQLDHVASYVGLRKIHVEEDVAGVPRLFLNNEPVFQLGLLDQGWWPDGLYSAPTDQALRYDIDVTKSLGFNLLRKHVKVEPQRFYYWCDRLGILVWQDMPSSLYDRPELEVAQQRAADQQWELELKRMIEHLHNHPSIVMWVPFNEGWGQYDTERITRWTKAYDPSRLVNNASGWTDKQVGDVRDVHAYPGPDMPPLESERAVVLGEFGGLALETPGHLWRESDENWGYRSLSTAEALQEHYAQLMVKLHDLKEKGLAAAVYTQTTDCETEINGVMTYDREVVKTDPAWARDLNQGYLPPRFASACSGFMESTRVGLWTRDPYATIRYTLDGSEPSTRSPLYAGPVYVDQDVVLRARCFWANGKRSVVVSKGLRKMDQPLAPAAAELTGAGLVCELFQGRWTQLPDFTKLTPVRTDVTASINLANVTDETRFALRMHGMINIPRTGVYRFSVGSDDGSKLWIAHQILVDNDGTHGMIEVSGEMALMAGWHPIELQYFQGSGDKGLNVFYEGPDLKKRMVPPYALGH